MILTIAILAVKTDGNESPLATISMDTRNVAGAFNGGELADESDPASESTDKTDDRARNDNSSRSLKAAVVATASQSRNKACEESEDEDCS